MKRPAIALTLLAALALSCAKPEAQFVGTYSGSTDLPRTYTDRLASMGVRPSADGKQSEVTLMLNADGTCTMTTKGSEKSVEQKGDWIYDAASKTVTLDITSPFLVQADIDEMKKKGMTDKMVERATKNPLVSETISDSATLKFTTVVNSMNLTMIFTKI